MKNKFYHRLLDIVTKEEILLDEPLKKHTTFKVGGPCDFFIQLKDYKKLPQVVALCKEENEKFFIIGNGSNLLACDEGYRGVVIRLMQGTEPIQIVSEEKGVRVTVEAGMNLCAFAMKVARLSLTGFEFAAGIPGTVGGAIYMNAGAYGGEIKDCLVSATVIDGDGQLLVLSNEDLKFSYRYSILQDVEYYVVSAEFYFLRGDDVKTIEAKIADFNGRRKDKQPLEYPSAGSTFKRPVGHYAGELIMNSGLRGYQIGGAQVSEKHCGFVINTGNATEKDITTLIQHVVETVKEKHGVTLETEVKYIR